MNMRTQHKKWLAAAAAVAALAAVFMLYLQPDFMRDMAEQIWACF